MPWGEFGWNKCGRVQAGSGGFVLIDVLVAFLVAGMVLFSITALHMQGNRMVGKSERMTVATHLAQERLELLKKQPPNFWKGLALPAMLSVEEFDGGYEVTVIAAEETTDPNLVRVTTRIQWREGNEKQVLELGTLYSKID